MRRRWRKVEWYSLFVQFILREKAAKEVYYEYREKFPKSGMRMRSPFSRRECNLERYRCGLCGPDELDVVHINS